MSRAENDIHELVQAGYRYALALTHHHYDAEDLVQQAWLKLTHRYGQVKHRSILYTAIRHLFYDQCRRGKIVIFGPLEDSQSLSADSVEQMLAAAKIVRPPVWRQPAWLAAAAALMLLLTAVGVLVQRTPPGITPIVAAEVARNHNKHLEPEARATDFAAIQKALPRLDFSIAPTRPDLLAGLTVRGGRYCSVQGQLAAQIALRDREGNPCTLYVVPLTDTLARVKPGVVTAGGAQIQLWRDAHRLYILAR